jgi:phosphatidyl-myo-inositol dimannoside synthase
MANGEYEGFGLVAPEAAAAGGMVLAADCDGLRDAVIDGVTGRLLPPADAPAWAAAVVDAARQSIEERAEQSAASQHEAVRRYNWKLVAQKTLTTIIE